MTQVRSALLMFVHCFNHKMKCTRQLQGGTATFDVMGETSIILTNRRSTHEEDNINGKVEIQENA